MIPRCLLRVYAGNAAALALVSCTATSCLEAPPPATPSLAHEIDAAVRIELVESPPAETTLDHPDVANAADAWVAMLDGATKTVDFAEFYASDTESGDLATSKLAPVLGAVSRAVLRGVKVRFLVDSVFAPKYPATLERLRRAGVTVRVLDFGTRGGGVLHAKYFVVDGVDAFVGSQNFDWRALEHIQEMGVRVRSSFVAEALLDILDTDWELAGGGPADVRVRHRTLSAGAAEERTSTGERIALASSPRGWLPDESSWDLPKLVALLDGARQSIDVQVLTYKTKERDGTPFPTLDDALRRAAARGVRVRLLVSDWSSKPGTDSRRTLDSLAQVPNVEVRVITIPRWSGGDIPYARVAHAKYLVVDAGSQAHKARAWVGTSNWEGDYFTKSRNVGLIASGGALPARLDGIFDAGWGGSYARPLVAAVTVRPLERSRRGP